MNIDNFTVLKANASSDKEYSIIHKEFINFIALPDSYIERMYKSKYSRHFYSQEEINAFKAKWCTAKMDIGA